MPILYPENEERVARGEQLLDEAIVIQVDAVELMGEFLDLTNQVNSAIRGFYESSNLSPPPLQNVTVKVEEYSFYIDFAFGAATGIIDLLFFDKFKEAIISRMVLAGIFTEEEAVKAVAERLGWSRGGWRAGLIVAVVTLVVTVGVGFLVQVEEGERQKKAALEAIQDLLVVRARFYLVRERLRILVDAVRGLAISLNVIKNMGMQLSPEQLQSIELQTLGNVRERIEALTPSSAYAALALRDLRRGWSSAHDLVMPKTATHLYSKRDGTVYVLDLWDSNRDNNAPVHAERQIHGSENQRWLAHRPDDGDLYLIISALSNKGLTIRSGDREPGATLVQYDLNHKDNQLWFLAKGPLESFFVVSRSSLFAMSLGEPLGPDHCSVVMNHISGERSQLWTYGPPLFDVLRSDDEVF